MYLAWSWTTERGLRNNRSLPLFQHHLLLNSIIIQSVLLNIFLLASIHQKAFPLYDLPSIASNPRITSKNYKIHEIGGTYEICCSTSPLDAIFLGPRLTHFLCSHPSATFQVPGRHQVLSRYLLVEVNEWRSRNTGLFYSWSKYHCTCFLCDFFSPFILFKNRKLVYLIFLLDYSHLPKTSKNVHVYIHFYKYEFLLICSYFQIGYFKFIHDQPTGL